MLSSADTRRPPFCSGSRMLTHVPVFRGGRDRAWRSYRVRYRSFFVRRGPASALTPNLGASNAGVFKSKVLHRRPIRRYAVLVPFPADGVSRKPSRALLLSSLYCLHWVFGLAVGLRMMRGWGGVGELPLRCKSCEVLKFSVSARPVECFTHPVLADSNAHVARVH